MYAIRSYYGFQQNYDYVLLSDTLEIFVISCDLLMKNVQVDLGVAWLWLQIRAQLAVTMRYQGLAAQCNSFRGKSRIFPGFSVVHHLC